VPRVGRDFSSYQGNLTPADVAGIDFAYVKATEGDSYQNPYAPQQTKALRDAGVEVGFYHFFDMGKPVLDQVHNFQLMVSTLGGTPLPPAIDWEQGDPAGWGDSASQLMSFATNVEGWTYPTPHPRTILYVNQSFDDALKPYGFPWGRWVWLAYPGTAPSRPCLVWQNGQATLSDGKSIDTDVFMGTDADWAEFTTGTATPAPAPTPPPAINLEEEVEVIFRRPDNNHEYATICGRVVLLDGPTSQALVAAGWKVVNLTPDAANAAGLG
jgi:lysozyme